MTTLYKRNAKGIPLFWSISKTNDTITIEHGIVKGTSIKDTIPVTSVKTDEVASRIKAKRKEGYKSIEDLKDNNNEEYFKDINSGIISNTNRLYNYLNTYLPKYSTTDEGFVLPMLAKVLEDNKPFDKNGVMCCQWKIDGLRCIIGAEKNDMDLFNKIRLTYHSRTGEDWTSKMAWMDNIILPELSPTLIDLLVEGGAYLDGELYLPGYQVNDINSFVKNESFPQHYQLQYWCYDICCENMLAMHRDEFRLNNIYVDKAQFNNKEAHLNNKQQLILLPTYNVADIKFATIMRDEFINKGFEGLIARTPNSEYQFGKRNQAMFKYKKIFDGLFTIVDIIPETKRSELPVFILRNDINEECFNCSINESHIQQEEYLRRKYNYIGKKMLVEYRARSGVNQLPFHARGISIK